MAQLDTSDELLGVKQWGNLNCLTKDTIDILFKNGFTSLKLVKLLKPTDIKSLNHHLPLAQELALANGIKELLSKGYVNKVKEREIVFQCPLNDQDYGPKENESLCKITETTLDEAFNIPSVPPWDSNSTQAIDISSPITLWESNSTNNEDDLTIVYEITDTSSINAEPSFVDSSVPTSQTDLPSVSETSQPVDTQSEITQICTSSPEKNELTVSTTTDHGLPALPPCSVCGAPSTGFHYGTNACGPCKGFFRRGTIQNVKYVCKRNKICNIKTSSRKECAYCRWQKCKAVGMAITASKIGRYTLEKLNTNIREVGNWKRLQGIIKHITEEYGQYTNYDQAFWEQLPVRQQKFKENFAIQKEMLGSLNPISQDLYNQIYQSTGMDIDGRKQVIGDLLPQIENSVKQCVCFAKSLPEFTELPLVDQVSLIRDSRMEIWLIICHKAFNAKDKLITYCCGKTKHVDQLTTVHDPEFIYKQFHIADQIQRLCLSQEETCIMAGLHMMSPDRASAEVCDTIERNQNTLLDCYNSLIKQNHPADKFILPKTISILTELRTLSHMNIKDITNLWDLNTLPPMVREVFFCRTTTCTPPQANLLDVTM